MDFLDPKKKRAHRNRLIVGYGLISIAIMLATAIVALMVYGYGYNRKTGKVIQNGLVFIDSKPVSANITVNGENKGQTSKRILLPEDNYTFLLSRDGYRDWQTTLNVRGGTIERLVYALLVPTKLTSKDLRTFASVPVLATQSPDYKSLVVLRSDSPATFESYDLGSKTPTPKSLALAASLVTADKKNSWQVVEWSTDNHNLLIKHTFGTKSEYLIIDIRNPAKSLNLSKLLSTEALNDVHLYNGKVAQIYYRNKANQLKLVNVASKNTILSLNGIVAYKSAGPDEIAYVTVPSTKTGLAAFGVYAAGLHTVHLLPKSSNYLVDIGKFDGHWYAAAGTPSDSKVFVYKDPVQELASSPTKILVPLTVLKSLHTPLALSFSPDSGYVSLQASSSFTVYDFKNSRLYAYDTRSKLDTGQVATWLDEYHLFATSSGKQNVWDFNGDNQQTLMAANTTVPMALSSNDKTLYSFGVATSSKKRIALSQTSLLVPGQ